MSETNSPRPMTPQRGPRRLVKLAAVALGGLLVGGFAGTAFSHGPFGPGFGPHFGGFHKVGFFGPRSIEDAQSRAERMAKHLAVEVDANAQQTEKLVSIAKALAADVYPMRETMQEARKRGIDLVTAPSLDRAAIEALRAEQMGKADALTKRLTTALADAAEVLTPDQRKVLAERVAEFRGRWGGPHKPLD
ncbi:MAG: Spy/CpxP family protein refolding chaperone [Hyphomicrobiaceae bacterium]|nr:Spy/CpxP family protein refolding chaperone [Hyphomicrobiaceae bacterium]